MLYLKYRLKEVKEVTMADIGDKLRSAREAKRLSIEDIEKATKIQSRYLTAIEQNDFEKLPGDFYVRAFIRQYAQVVGLDGKKLLGEYHQEVPKAEPDEYVEDSIDNKSEEVEKTTNNKKKIWQTYLPRVVIGLGIVVIVLMCYVVYAHFSSTGNQNNDTTSDVSVSSGTNKHTKPKRVIQNPVKIKELAVNQYQVTGLKNKRNLVVRAGNQATTVTIMMNGINQSSQTLVAGQKHTLRIPKNVKTLSISFSNAQGTSIFIGGKKVPYEAQSMTQTLTFYIGKRNSLQSNQSRETNSNQSNSSDNSNNTVNHNYNSTHTGNQQSHSEQQSNATNSNETTDSHSQQNNQANQQPSDHNDQIDHTENNDQNSGSNNDDNH